MKKIELSPEFNLLGQTDLNNVKISLDRDEMENIVGGRTNPFRNSRECFKLAEGLGGAAMIFGAASWWTGAGAGLSMAMSAGAFAFGYYCKTL